MWVFCHGWFPQLTPPIPRRQQRSLHLPAPAKTRCRKNGPGIHALPGVFSMLNCEDCSFSLPESVQPTNVLFRTTFRPAEMLHSFATMTYQHIRRKGPILTSYRGESSPTGA